MKPRGGIPLSWKAYELIRDAAPAGAQLAGFSDHQFGLDFEGETSLAIGQFVTGHFFEVLGIRPSVGRLFTAMDETEPGADPVVVLSHGFWVRAFGSDPSIVGRSISVDGQSLEVVGVTERDFVGPEKMGFRPSIFVPATMNQGYRGSLPFGSWQWSWIKMVGRLPTEATFEQASAALPALEQRLRLESERNEQLQLRIADGIGLDPVAQNTARDILLMLSVIAGLVLLATMATVVNLTIARATSRRHEVGVRMAIGASRGRVLSQLTTENVFLCLFATAVTAPLIWYASAALPAILPYRISTATTPDGTVVALMTALGLGMGLLLGAIPAWMTTRFHAATTLKEGTSTDGRRPTRLRDTLLVSQTALSMALLAGAALLGKSILNAHTALPGFDPDGLTAVSVSLEDGGESMRDVERAALVTLVRSATDLPDVSQATVANQLPIIGGQSMTSTGPIEREEMSPQVEYNVVGPNYFETLGIPLVRGRSFADAQGEPERVAVVNATLANLLWPDEDPIGRQLRGDPPWRVIGVVGDVQMRSLRSPANPAIYYPTSQAYQPRMVLIARSRSGNVMTTDEAARLIATAPGISNNSPPIPIREEVARSLEDTRTMGYIVGGFAALAALLAGLGIYGLVAESVTLRTREMAVRLALGARPGALVDLMLRHAVRISFVGILAGLGASAVLGRSIERLLYAVEWTDPWALMGAAILLFASAVASAWLPARRASRISGTEALTSGG